MTATAPSEAEVVVIGAGPGGYVAAIRAAQRGLDVALVERAAVGGVCLNHGCVPSKAVIDTADAAHRATEMAHRGVSADVAVDYADLAGWKDGVVDRLTGGVRRLCEANDVTLVEGTAEFVDDGTVRVTPKDLTAEVTTIEFEHAVVATGSRPVELPGFDFADDPVLDSRDALALADRPESLVVVGAGYIGMELATAFAKLGTDVTVVEFLDAPLPGYDDGAADLVQSRAEALGIEFNFGESAVEWYEDIVGDVAVVTETEDGSQREYVAEAVLVAVGREPVTDTLNLDAVGLEPDEDGFLPADGDGRTPVDSVYAIGDVAGEPMLAHKASHEGIRAAEAIAGTDPADEAGPAQPFPPVPAVVFTDPEIATVGLTAADAEAAGHEVAVGSMPFSASGRALAADETEGSVRVVVDAETGRLLGGRVVGPEASELVGELGLAVSAELRVEDVTGAVHAHPTLAEAIAEAAENAIGEAIHTVNR